MRVKLKEKEDWFDVRIANGSTFESKKIIEFHSFSNHQEALNWAGQGLNKSSPDCLIVRQ